MNKRTRLVLSDGSSRPKVCPEYKKGPDPTFSPRRGVPTEDVYSKELTGRKEDPTVPKSKDWNVLLCRKSPSVTTSGFLFVRGSRVQPPLT